MMLVYDLPVTDAIYQRFIGIDGSAYFVGGVGMTALTFNNVVVVPIRSGVGLRLGANDRISEIHAHRDLESFLKRDDRSRAGPATASPWQTKHLGQKYPEHNQRSGPGTIRKVGLSAGGAGGGDSLSSVPLHSDIVALPRHRHAPRRSVIQPGFWITILREGP
jgi:hypothetical protein